MASGSTKKTVMNHSLAKALMEAGMQHFDVGGSIVQGGSTPSSTPGGGIRNGISQAVQLSNLPLNGILDGLTQGTTVQNLYTAELAPQNNANYGAPLIQPGWDQEVAGYNRSQEDRSRQLALESILMDQARGGGGPSPAQAQLARTTGQNIQAQGALMAGTRGGGANVGILAKQAAQQGGQLQQQAATDAAILRANEQIAARQQLQNQQSLIGGQNITQQGIGANVALTGADIGQRAAISQNENNIKNYGMAQGINAKTSEENTKSVNDRKGGLLKSIPIIGGLFSKGGTVPDHIQKVARIAYPQHFDDGGFVDDYRNTDFDKDEKKEGSSKGMSGGFSPEMLEQLGPLLEMLGGAGAIALKQGGKVPGRAQVKGDSVKNDTVPIVVSPGEDILPRSVTMAKNAPEKAAEFVRHLQDQKKKKDYGQVAKSKKSLQERVSMLEAYLSRGAGR